MKVEKIRQLTITILFALFFVITLSVIANAMTMTIHPDNQGITSMSYSVNDLTSTIEIWETWTASGYGFIKFEELSENELNRDYTIIKHIKNSTGTAWARFSNELLDKYVYGQGLEDDASDPQPYPSWVPAGYSTSNGHDGLSFAEGSGIPRTSLVFGSLIEDELTDHRDFLDFYNGTISGLGGEDTLSYGLRMSFIEQQPFLLAERPNEFAQAVPEPSTLILLGAGALVLGLCRVYGNVIY